MQQKRRFHENESVNKGESRYDSETVRKVLGRAVAIETKTEPEVEVPLTAVQVEALGVKLGLTPEAVRRALGELHPETRTASVRVDTLSTMPQMASTLLPGLIYAFLLTALFKVFTLMTASLLPPSWFGVIVVLCVLVVPSLLSL